MMTRYEYIKQGGIEEMAKAMAFVLCKCVEEIDDCEILRGVVRAITPTFVEWLNEEIEE